MRHRQSWGSRAHKVEAWLELCELSFQLMKEGIKLTNPGVSPEDEAYSRLEKLSKNHHQLNEEILKRMSK